MANSRLPAPPDPQSAPNRFAGAGVARLGDDFTDRDVERRDIARSLLTPRGHMLISGLRRMGKTSVLLAVQDELRAAGHAVLYVDLWTASSLEDMTARIARAAAEALGRSWTHLIREFGQRLKFSFEVSETASGLLIPVPKLEFRDAPLVEQRARLVSAFELLESLAKEKKSRLSVILDEFQEIERLGAEGSGAAGVSPLRQLRAVVQQQSHVTYAFAGSDARLIAAVQSRENGALYNFARQYVIGPIEPAHFAGWIEAQFGAMGINAVGQGCRIIELAGPRTRDVRTLAESVAESTRQSARVSEEGVVAGMLNLLRERAASYEMSWRSLTPLQQNVLRAVAAEGRGLARAVTRKEFALGEASRVSKAIDALVERDVLVRDGARTVFDDPFYRAWVVVHVLPDVGRHHAVTYLPEE
jgi:hypothetical protein